MEGHRKERSSKHHMKIDLGREEANGGLLLANPMACGDISPNNGSLGIGGRSERGSMRKSRPKSPKSPSLLRFFVRSGSGRKGSSADEDQEDYASSGSEHDDPFSVPVSEGERGRKRAREGERGGEGRREASDLRAVCA